MAEGLVNIPRFVSPKQPIRLALGKLGFSNLMQTLEPDLVAWTAEALGLISRKKTFSAIEIDAVIEDNVVPHCPDFSMIECVKIAGVPLTYQPDGSCHGVVTDNCRCICIGSEKKFTVDESYIHFVPVQSDGTAVKIKYYKRPMGDDGYPLVNEACVLAVTEYLKWQICFRERDNRSAACEARWYVLCRQARAIMNTWTQQQLENFGLIWY